ncbi:hypothetical protein COCOBI_06-1070 [Coccomyxa sp. Obi]|nr:hypothetical protein COCOBI_06-1070 [Coccomyxa sp. Obi]
MRQRQSWPWRPPGAWRALQLLIAASFLALCSAEGEGHPGDVVHGPDPATMFEVQGRTFWNKSLGLDQLPHGVLGHQCSSARPGPHPTDFLTYTPNRRWPADPSDGRSAIVMAVGGEPERFYTRIMAAWTTWQGYFTKAIRENTVLILLMDANFWTELDTLGEKLHLERLDCTMHRHTCDLAARMDQGYTVFILNRFIKYPDSVTYFEPQEPFVIFAGIKQFPHPFWIERRNQTEAEVLSSDWRTEECNKANYAYTKFTNWYSYHMFDELRILDYFDYWWKIDDDVRWFGDLPIDITKRLVEERRIFFHTAMDFDPWWCIGPSLAESIELFLDMESDLCGRPLRAVAFDKIWWTNDSYIYLSEFVGGWLGMYTSPELMEYARIWNYYPYSMWTWRWGDQQFWTKANGMFDDGSGILDLSHLKQHDTSGGPPKGKTSMMFYHG